MFVIFDYILTYNWRIFIYECVIPFVIVYLSSVDYYIIVDSSLNSVGILLGFSLAALTLFLTGNDNIQKTKGFQTGIKVRGEEISLYN
ncbi:MAG: hypothetical protein M0P12_07500 [Paludibacteraceae bacterium]|nr:hypothetical protein [Paludibacteraceae bacterium]